MSFAEYNNLFLFMESRKWTQIPSEVLKQEIFEKTIRLFGYIPIYGKNADNEDSVIILVSRESTISHHKQHFMRMFNKEHSKAKHMIIVSESLLSASIQNAPEISSSNVTLESISATRFRIDIRRAALVPVHRIMTKKESEELLNFWHCEAHQLPKIKLDDPQVIWLGAKVGDVIEITRMNEMSGEGKYWRVVVK